MSASPDILRDFSALQSDVARLSEANVELTNKLMEAKRERDEAREQLHTAVGLLSTHPQFEDKHPEEVLRFVKEAAK